MKVTKIHIEVLLGARKLIASGEVGYICFAMDEYTLNTRSNYRTEYYELKGYIERQLFPSSSYEAWILLNYPEISTIYHIMSREEQIKAAKQGRLDWIDNMIKDFQEIIK